MMIKMVLLSFLVYISWSRRATRSCSEESYECGHPNKQTRAHTFIYISPEYLSRLPEKTKRQRHSSIYSVFDSVSNRNARRHVVVLVRTNSKQKRAQDLSVEHPKRYRGNVFLTLVVTTVAAQTCRTGNWGVIGDLSVRSCQITKQALLMHVPTVG